VSVLEVIILGLPVKILNLKQEKYDRRCCEPDILWMRFRSYRVMKGHGLLILATDICTVYPCPYFGRF
jgi:hypothetical protein